VWSEDSDDCELRSSQLYSNVGFLLDVRRHQSAFPLRGKSDVKSSSTNENNMTVNKIF